MGVLPLPPPGNGAGPLQGWLSIAPTSLDVRGLDGLSREHAQLQINTTDA